MNRGYEGASVPVGNPLEPAPPATAELRVTTCGCPTCREHCLHPATNRQYDKPGVAFFCTRCGGTFYAY